jgi:hypothetical protein
LASKIKLLLNNLIKANANFKGQLIVTIYSQQCSVFERFLFLIIDDVNTKQKKLDFFQVGTMVATVGATQNVLGNILLFTF